jgi:hypothetical protein
MSKQGECLKEQIEKLQNDYGACKINKHEFIEGLNKIGIYTEEEVEWHLDDAESARYEFKLDGTKPTTTVLDIPMPFPEEK